MDWIELSDTSPPLYITEIQTVAEQSVPTQNLLSVCQDTANESVSDDVTYEQVPLADDEISQRKWGGSCSYTSFCEAVDTARELFSDGGCTIHCHHGKNRSAAVCAALIVTEGYADDYNEAIQMVRDARRIVDPNDIMRGHALRYITNQ